MQGWKKKLKFRFTKQIENCIQQSFVVFRNVETKLAVNVNTFFEEVVLKYNGYQTIDIFRNQHVVVHWTQVNDEGNILV